MVHTACVDYPDQIHYPYLIVYTASHNPNAEVFFFVKECMSTIMVCR